MIVIYTALLFVLSVILFLVKRRVARLEKKLSRATAEAKEALRLPLAKEGNSNKTDPYETARRQYLLGVLVQKRDRVEARHTAWQRFADKFEACVKNVRAWRGKRLPYFCGALDVAGLVTVLDLFGKSSYVNLRSAVSAGKHLAGRLSAWPRAEGTAGAQYPACRFARGQLVAQDHLRLHKAIQIEDIFGRR